MDNHNVNYYIKEIPRVVWYFIIGISSYAFGYFGDSHQLASIGLILVGLGFLITVMNVAMILGHKFRRY